MSLCASMNPTVMDVTPSQLQTFGDVWQQLLVQKVGIIYQISQHKGVDFSSLLEEFIPESLEHKDLWASKYIISSSDTKKSESNCTKLPKKKFKFKSKSSSPTSSKSSESSSSVSDSVKVKKLKIKTKPNPKIKIKNKPASNSGTKIVIKKSKVTT